MHPMRFAMAWPTTGRPLGLPIVLNGSAFVTCSGSSTSYESWGIGWPGGAPVSGVAGLLLELRGPPGPFFFGLSPLLTRNLMPAYCGDPQAAKMPLDTAPFSTFRLSNVALYLHWLALDSRGRFVTSPPLLVHL